MPNPQKSARKPLWFAREWLDLTGVKQSQIVEKTGHSKSEVSGWVSGKRRFNADVLWEFADIMGVTPSDLLRDPKSAQGREALLIGKVGAGAEIIRLEHPDVLAGIPMPIGLNAPNVAEIEGDSQYPLQPGWLIFYGPENQGVPDECIGKLSVVQIVDGPTLLKTLKRGSKKNLFRLESWNAPPREDVKVVWAAKVMDIRPR